MINVITKDGTTNAAVKGDCKTLCADTCAIVHAVWTAITKKDKTAAQAYEKFMREEFAAWVFDEEPEPENAKQEQGDDEFVNAIVDAVIAAIMRSKS